MWFADASSVRLIAHSQDPVIGQTSALSLRILCRCDGLVLPSFVDVISFCFPFQVGARPSYMRNGPYHYELVDMSSKQRKTSIFELRYDRTYRSKTNLRQRMSELISLRERVAQAELVAPQLDVEAEWTSDKRHRRMKNQS